ncbi:MAG: ABC transporter permease [Burkholderiales bacterium]|nr:MAG: ABC transporter permease [Burkholderiales bacterium]
MSATRVGPDRGRGQWLALACLLGPALVFLVVFYLTPFVRMLVESVHDPQAAAGLGLFSLEHYEKMLASGRIRRALMRTVRISALSTLITLILAYPLALYLREAGRRVRTVVLSVVFVSLASSLIGRNYGWLVTLSDAGPVNSLLQALGIVTRPLRLVYNESATVVALVHYAIPFMVLPIFAALIRIPDSLSESARSLGAPPHRVLREIVWPLSIPGVFGGTVLTFSLCMSAFVTPLMLGSPATSMISQVAAEQFLVQLAFPYGSAIIVTLTALTFTIVFVYAVAVRKVFRVHV